MKHLNAVDNLPRASSLVFYTKSKIRSVLNVPKKLSGMMFSITSRCSYNPVRQRGFNNDILPVNFEK